MERVDSLPTPESFRKEFDFRITDYDKKLEYLRYVHNMLMLKSISIHRPSFPLVIVPDCIFFEFTLVYEERWDREFGDGGKWRPYLILQMLNGTAPDDFTMVCAAKLGYRSKGSESIGS